MKWRYAAITIAVALIIIIYLFAHSFIGGDRFARAEKILTEYKNDALALNQDVLRTRFGYLLHYDPLKQRLREMTDLQNKLSAFIKEYNPPGKELKGILDEKLVIKKHLVVEFMRNNSVLRNSAIYLPIAVTALTQRHVKQGSLLNSLLLNVLLYSSSGNQALSAHIKRIIAQLEQQSLQEEFAKDQLLTNMIKHANTILTYHPRLAKITQQVLGVNIVGVINKVIDVYKGERDRYIQEANNYRLLLFAFSLLLMLTIVWMVYRLRQSLVKQQKTNVNLNKEMIARVKAEEEIKQHNVKLEKEVARRTQTIRDTNNKLMDEIKRHKKTTDFLRQAQTQAKQLEQAKSSFLAGLSQNIHTSLLEITQSLDKIKQSTLDEAQNKNIETAFFSCDSLNKLLSDILDYAKIEANMLVIENKEFDFQKLILTSIDKLEQQAKAKDLTFDKKIPEDLPNKLIGDAARIKQAFESILMHAIKETTKGGVNLQMTCRAEDKSMIARFEITDTSAGIPEKTLELIRSGLKAITETTTTFDKEFHIRLAVSRELIKLMGGQFDISSEEGKGTKISFSLHLNKP